jgi:hypothetical protein
MKKYDNRYSESELSSAREDCGEIWDEVITEVAQLVVDEFISCESSWEVVSEKIDNGGIKKFVFEYFDQSDFDEDFVDGIYGNVMDNILDDIFDSLIIMGMGK